MDLLSEYCSRHQTKFLWATTDGVLFLDKDTKPALICITSEHARQVSCCGACKSDHRLVVECLVPHPRLWQHTKHEHVDPQINLQSYLHECYPNYVSHAMSSRLEMEVWAWEFFMQASCFRDTGFWKAFMSGSSTKNIDQMAYCSLHLREQFQMFYQRYEQIIAARNYLLWK